MVSGKLQKSLPELDPNLLGAEAAVLIHVGSTCERCPVSNASVAKVEALTLSVAEVGALLLATIPISVCSESIFAISSCVHPPQYPHCQEY